MMNNSSWNFKKRKKKYPQLARVNRTPGVLGGQIPGPIATSTGQVHISAAGWDRPELLGHSKFNTFCTYQLFPMLPEIPLSGCVMGFKYPQGVERESDSGKDTERRLPAATAVQSHRVTSCIKFLPFLIPTSPYPHNSLPSGPDP